MDITWQLILIGALILVNAVFAGAEIALVSLREGQLRRLARTGKAGAALADLASDPNRFLATIQIAITLSGFFASASAAVTLARPVTDALSFLGQAAYPVSVAIVTLGIAYVTLVIGELAPKRLAMQRAETWGLLVARPLSALSRLSRPLVWLLSKSADLIVRLLGGDPDLRSQEVTQEEVRDLVAGVRSFDPEQREIIAGAFDISERTLRQVLRPRPQVVVLDEAMTTEEGLGRLITAGYSRAPVAPGGRLDDVSGVVHVRDLITGSGRVADLASPPLVFPESVGALEALRVMRVERQHMAIVVSEYGSSEGIVTIEDLLEELVGEIYDESDRDVLRARWHPHGVIEVPGSFPIHDLEDIGVDLPTGDYTTVGGLILDRLGRIPDAPGDEVVVEGWRLAVLEVHERAITLVRLTPLGEES